MLVDKEIGLMNELQNKIDIINKCILPSEINKKLEEIKKEQESPNFWNDQENAQKINKHAKYLTNKLEVSQQIADKKQYIDELIELLGAQDDAEMLAELDNEIKNLTKIVDTTFLQTLLSEKYDDNNAILTIHSGAGGTESQDWSNMLYRMYTRFAERNDYSVKVLDIQQ